MHSKRSKMVLGVGDEEAAKLEERYHQNGFGDLYPKLREIGREEIEELEPKVVEGRDPTTALKALQTPDGYVVDYGAVAKSFVDAAREEDGVGVHLGTAVENVDEGTTGSRSRPTTATSRPTRSSSPPAPTASSSPRRWGTASTCRCFRSRGASSSPTTC